MLIVYCWVKTPFTVIFVGTYQGMAATSWLTYFGMVFGSRRTGTGGTANAMYTDENSIVKTANIASDVIKALFFISFSLQYFSADTLKTARINLCDCYHTI